jgi:hypothetical protein
MKQFHFVLTTLLCTIELGLMIYMFSGHYTDQIGVATLVVLAFSIIFFLFYLLQEKQDEIEKLKRRSHGPYSNLNNPSNNN